MTDTAQSTVEYVSAVRGSTPPPSAADNIFSEWDDNFLANIGNLGMCILM